MYICVYIYIYTHINLSSKYLHTLKDIIIIYCTYIIEYCFCRVE